MNSWAALVDALCARQTEADAPGRLRAARRMTPMLEMLWLASRGLLDPVSGDAARVSSRVDGSRSSGPVPSMSASAGASDVSSGQGGDRTSGDGSGSAGRTGAVDAQAGVSDDETRRSQIYVEVSSGGESLPGAQRVHVAGAASLGQKLQLERAFAALRSRRVTPRGEVELDVERTVEQFAATGRVRAVWRSKRGRWLDLAVIVERSPTMRFWQATADHFVPVADRGLGALRTRVLFLQHEANRLSLSDRHARVRALDLPGKDSMVLYLTDTLGSGWASGSVPTRLAHWSRQRPVVLVHVLPSRFWPRTPLANVLPLASWHHTNKSGLADQGPPVPLLSYLDVVSLRKVTRALAGRGEQGALRLSGREEDRELSPQEIGSRFRSDDADEFEDDRHALSVPFSAEEIEELWQDFEACAAPSTRRLAVYLAAAPLVMPVMRLIERTFVPEAAPWQIAELVMSGLIRRRAGSNKAKDKGEDRIENIEYEFLPGIRERLLQEAGELCRRQVIRELTRYVERRFGRAREFEAVCAGDGAAPSVAGDATGYAPFLRSAEVVGRLFPRRMAGWVQRQEAAEQGDRIVPLRKPSDEWEDSVRARTGQAPHAVPMSISDVLSAAIERTREPAMAQAVELRSQIDRRVDPASTGDAEMLQLMLMDLIRHALTYTRNGYITLHAELQHEPAENQPYQDLKLTVEDTGGADSRLVRQRLNDSRSSPSGAGPRGTLQPLAEVPIAYCRDVIDAMGGTIGVSSVPGHTTSVWLRFPLDTLDVVGFEPQPPEDTGGEVPPTPRPSPVPEPEPVPVSDSVAHHLCSILVVSTDVERSETIVAALRDAGMDVAHESSLQGFFLRMATRFDQWSRGSFNAVLVDVQKLDIALIGREIDSATGGMGPDRFGTKFLAIADSIAPEDQRRLERCGFAATQQGTLRERTIVRYVSTWTGLATAQSEAVIVDDLVRSDIASPNLLLVSMEVGAASKIIAALRSIAASVTTADTDLQAVEKLAADSYDIVLVDLDAASHVFRTLLRLWRITGTQRNEPCPIVIGVSPEGDADDLGVKAWLPPQARDHDIQHVVLDELERRLAWAGSPSQPSSGRARVLYMADKSNLPRIGEIELMTSGYEVVVADASSIAKKAGSGVFDLALVDVDRSPRNVDVHFLRGALQRGGNDCPIVAVVDPGRAKVESAPERGFDQAISCYAQLAELGQMRRWMASNGGASRPPVDRAAAAAAVLDELSTLDLLEGSSSCRKVRALVRWDDDAMNAAFERRTRERLGTLRNTVSPDAAAAMARLIGAMCRVMEQPELARSAKNIEAAVSKGSVARPVAEFDHHFNAVLSSSGLPLR